MPERIYPRIRLTGTDLVRRLGVIYTQILCDLQMKVDDGSGSEYPKGFLHTSTTNLSDPCYYAQMWSRDAGRGVMELARSGLIADAESVADYISSRGKDYDDHYGRIINRERCGSHEVDGNVNLLLAFYEVWNYGGRKPEKGQAYLENAKSVFEWFEKLADECPYGDLLASKSELSGNANTVYFIYAVFATYGAMIACHAYAEMAAQLGETDYGKQLTRLEERFCTALTSYLVSEGKNGGQDTKTPAGVWLNGLDERSGKAAEIGDFGPEFDISRWTRQLPFVQDFDCAFRSTGTLAKINAASYEYIRDGMCEGYFFRRYGFVSNTCFSGMGGRHDDTMAGYGQNFFSQAALMNDDVNVYTKCLEGIARLAYDGDIVAPKTFELNPWVMHECFTYENYEQGLDHTYGRDGDRFKKIMHNPGDEGNLVQSAETLKTMALVVGLGADGDCLEVTPRMPWEAEKAEIRDFPVVTAAGLRRISYTYEMDRVENRFELKLTGADGISKAAVRLGPLPNILFDEAGLRADGWKIARKHNAVFAERVFEVKDGQVCAALVNEKR